MEYDYGNTAAENLRRAFYSDYESDTVRLGGTVYFFAWEELKRIYRESWKGRGTCSRYIDW